MQFELKIKLDDSVLRDDLLIKLHQFYIDIIRELKNDEGILIKKNELNFTRKN